MTIVTIMLFIIFALVYSFTQRSLETESIRMMNAIAANPFHAGHPDISSSELKLPFFTLQLGMDGRLVSADGGYYDLSNEAFLNTLIEKAMQGRQDTGILTEYNLRYCRVKAPMGTVLVFSDMSSETTTLGHLLQSFAVIGLASFLLFLGISIFLAKWAVRPVEKAWRQQKQFVAAASHELKTPLTVIMTNAELLQYKDYSETEREHFLSGITQMTRQMKLLVEKMLLLAKSDDQANTLSMNTVPLSRLVLDTAISFEGIFAEKGLSLESFAEPDITVYGNEEALQQVIVILLDNAQKYSKKDSATHIVLCHKDKSSCCLKVSNAGTPIPQEELKNIFQPFYRMDRARSRDGSFGLGLSIAENIITQHKGKIWVESQDGINSFFVELRKKQQPPFFPI